MRSRRRSRRNINRKRRRKQNSSRLTRNKVRLCLSPQLPTNCIVSYLIDWSTHFPTNLQQIYCLKHERHRWMIWWSNMLCYRTPSSQLLLNIWLSQRLETSILLFIPTPCPETLTDRERSLRLKLLLLRKVFIYSSLSKKFVACHPILWLERNEITI